MDATNDIDEIGKPTRERYVMLETCYVSVVDSLDTQIFIEGQKKALMLISWQNQIELLSDSSALFICSRHAGALQVQV
jgi:hypothetical protein